MGHSRNRRFKKWQRREGLNGDTYHESGVPGNSNGGNQRRREPITSQWLDDIRYIADAVDNVYARMHVARRIYDEGLMRNGVPVNSKEETSAILHSGELKNDLDRTIRLLGSWLDKDVKEIRYMFSNYWPKKHKGDNAGILEATEYFEYRVGEMTQKLSELKTFSSNLEADGVDTEALLRSGFELVHGLSHSKTHLSSISYEIVKALKLMQQENRRPRLRT